MSIDPAAAILLHGTNAKARIRYTRIARRHVMTKVGELGTSEPVFFVTLIDERFTLGLNVAKTINIRRLQAWARAELPGCHFFGMVEAALYTNVGVVRARMIRAVSWHVHLIVWGISEARLSELIDSLNRRRKTLVPGVTPGHYRLLDRTQIEGRVIYSLKPPMSDYRIYEIKTEMVDRVTGEVHKEGTGQFEQKKQDLRPGHLARMTNIMADMLLDKLAFAAGDGRAVLKAINHEALAPFRLFEARRRRPLPGEAQAKLRAAARAAAVARDRRRKR